MFILDIANPLTLLLILLATVLMIFLAQELKKSYISAIPLFLYLILLVIHVVQLVTLKPQYVDNTRTLSFCIAIDCACCCACWNWFNCSCIFSGISIFITYIFFLICVLLFYFLRIINYLIIILLIQYNLF